MINLLSPDQKHDIKAARMNVVLLRYCIVLISIGFTMVFIFGLGFWLVMQDKNAVTAKLASQSEQSKAYDDVEKQADSFRKNLVIAKQILTKETTYSTFLTTLAATVPSGAILTNLSLGGPATVAQTQKGLTLDARANSYTKVLEMKQRLEQSSLFENVNIASTNRPDDISKLTGLEAKYPYEASFNVKLSSQNKATQ